MSKSILVIDTTDNCWECEFANGQCCAYGMRAIEKTKFEIHDKRPKLQ